MYPLVSDDEVPSSPNNVSVRWHGNSLLITWFPPLPRTSPVTVGCYLVEYRTLGHWVPLAERVAASERPSYRWTTASRSATYHFRVFSVGAPCRPDVEPLLSRPSLVVSFRTSGEFARVRRFIPPARRNETETRQFRNCFETVSFQPEKRSRRRFSTTFPHP